MRPTLTADLVAQVAERFRALGEPARLRIVRALMDGELSVGALVDRTGLGQANVSKHLQVLHRYDFVTRRRDGAFVHYSLAGTDVFKLCDIMCGRLGGPPSPSEE